MNKIYKSIKYSINIILMLSVILLPFIIGLIPLLIIYTMDNTFSLNWLILSIPIAIIFAFFMWPGGKLYYIIGIDSYIDQNKILGEHLNGIWNKI